MSSKLENISLIILFLIFSFCCPTYSQEELSSHETEVSSPIKLEARIDIPLELNLEKALSIALTNNLEVLQSEYGKEIEKWRLWENIGNFLPDYKVGFSEQRLDGNFLIGGIFPIKALTTSANAFMRFDYRFFEGGKGFFNTLAARNLYKSSKENLAYAKNIVLLGVTKAYNKLLAEEANLDVLKAAVEEAKADLELNQKLEKQGTNTRFDVLQADAQLSEQEQAYIAQQSKFREASISLARLLNLEQGTHIKPDQKDLSAKKLFNIDTPVPEIISLAIKNRPEIKKTQLDYLASRNYIGVAYSAFLPKADFFGQYGGSGNAVFHRTKIKETIPDAIALDENGNPIAQSVVRNRSLYQTFTPQVDLTHVTNVSNIIRGAGAPFNVAIDDSLMTNRFLGVEVGWDILDGLGLPTVSRINQARSQARIAKIAINITNQKIEEEVRTAYLKVQTQDKLIEVAAKRVKSATEALHLAKVRLENGVGINTELLNAQKQFTGALASQVESIVEYNNAQAELLYALGLISVENLIKNIN